MAKGLSYEELIKQGAKPEGAGLTFEQLKAQGATIPKEPGFIQSIAQALTSPFLRTAATATAGVQGLVNVAQAGISKLRGDEEGVQRNIQEGLEAVDIDREFDFGYLGRVKPISSTKEAIGTGVEAFGTILPVGKVGALAKPTIGRLVGQGIKTGAKIGAESGALMGVGQALQRDEDLTDTFFAAASGAVIGGLGGGVIGGAAPVAMKIYQKYAQPFEQRINEVIKDSYFKAIKPSISKVRDLNTLSQYENRASNAIATIVDNKPNLKFVTEVEEKTGVLPGTVSEFSDAISQTKKNVFEAYNTLTKQTGRAGELVDLKPIANELDIVANDITIQDNFPNVAIYAEQKANLLRTRGAYTPELAEKAISQYNQALKAFYSNPTYEAASKVRVDAMVVNKLRESLDNLITQTTGAEYQILKNQYGALRAIENDVAKAAARMANRNTKGLIDFSDIFSGGDMVRSVLTLDPSLFARGLAQKGIATWFKSINNPDRIIKKMFQEVEKNVIKIKTGKIPPLQPIEKAVKEYIKNPKIGLSIEDISRQSENQTVSSKIIQPKTAKPTATQGPATAPTPIKNKAIKSIINKTIPPYTDSGKLTLKTLKKLEGRTTVSKQFIQDLTNAGDIKQSEKDILRKTLEDYKGDIPVQEFANKVKTELLPLRVNLDEFSRGGLRKNTLRYESVTLPDELRGPVARYDEHIYESPIKTSAGDVHQFATDSYFAHARIEDLATSASPKTQKGKLAQQGATKESLESQSYSNNNTRRIIEIQSDLFQKGRLEGEAFNDSAASLLPTAERQRVSFLEKRLMDLEHAINKADYVDEIPQLTKERDVLMNKARKLAETASKSRTQELSKLEPYRNTWHERVIREEIKQAAKDGKTKLQFPTGETAMKIEGLGETSIWADVPTYEKYVDSGDNILLQEGKLKANDLKVGKEVIDVREGSENKWIITDVLGDGKFKAVPKNVIDNGEEWLSELGYNYPDDVIADIVNSKNGIEGTALSGTDVDLMRESFDISGKVDEQNPIFRWYNKDVRKFLVNKYNAKEIIDPQGVSWLEIQVKPEYKKLPIEAFGVLPLIPVKKDEKGK